MIKKRIILVILAIISLIFSYYLINSFIVELSILQFIGIEAINMTLNYLQDEHKKKMLKT
jgi:hypothetical protein